MIINDESKIINLAKDLGFANIAIINPHLEEAINYYRTWLNANYHGDMMYLERHSHIKAKPELLLNDLKSIICVNLNYASADLLNPSLQHLKECDKAYISLYALGRDYHKVLRKKLKQFALQIKDIYGDYDYRVFTDSAPIMEVEMAVQGGLGWRGKNTLLLNRSGSLFFLGEIFTNLNLENTPIEASHCGSCNKCINICPTKAFVAPYQIDARRCISYLTIEYSGSIPLEIRPLIGNRIYGCDDCQLICPWNRFAQRGDSDFIVREQINNKTLLELISWSAQDFYEYLAGSAILRIGHANWLRNISVAIANSAQSNRDVSTLKLMYQKLLAWQNHDSEIVSEHVNWALLQIEKRLESLKFAPVRKEFESITANTNP